MNLARFLSLALPALAATLIAAPAHAYIGPGVGLGVIGTVFGIVATLALAVFGFLWYPMKRLLAKRRGKKAQAADTAAPAAPAAATNATADATPGAATGASAEPVPPALATGRAADGTGAASGPDALAPTSVRAPVADADVRRPHAEEA